MEGLMEDVKQGLPWGLLPWAWKNRNKKVQLWGQVMNLGLHDHLALYDWELVHHSVSNKNQELSYPALQFWGAKSRGDPQMNVPGMLSDSDRRLNR